MQFLSESHPRDAAVLFEELDHKYTVCGRSDFTSVTTFIGKLFPPFDADAVVTKMMSGRNWAKSAYYGMTREEIKAKWQEAADLGTRMHADIEHFYKGEPYENQTPEFQQFLKFNAELPPGLRPHRSEWRVYNEDVGIVGTIDMIYVDEAGGFHIYDWKRTKSIVKDSPFGKALHPAISDKPDTNYWHYALQLNLYQFLLESKYGVNVMGRTLVCMHPEREAFELVPVVDMQSEIKCILQDPDAKFGRVCLLQPES
jgi:hypothetical protein